jgi:hypothetical protein
MLGSKDAVECRVGLSEGSVTDAFLLEAEGLYDSRLNL